MTFEKWLARRRFGAQRLRAAWRAGRGLEPGATRIVHPSPMILPESGTPLRHPPRKPEERQPDYLEKFDARTLFYDAFAVDDDVVLSGPPLLNLKPWVTGARVLVDKKEYGRELVLSDWGRTQRSRLVGAAGAYRVTLRAPGASLSSVVGRQDVNRFAGRRALLTMSKNNELTWIRDWLQFYRDVHGVDAVVIYDNESSIYAPEELAAAIDSVRGIEAAAVVPWPFPYGPGGGPAKRWDSDFCQYSALEHARLRFLAKADAVINCDIDELVVCADGRSVVEHAKESAFGVVRYHGEWIAKATERPLDPNRVARFIDYRYTTGQPTTAKWTAIPGRLGPKTQWRVHSIAGLEVPVSTDITHRHFQGINNDWKYDRREELVDPARHHYDADLARALKSVFGELS